MKIYLADGSSESFFTAVFDAYNEDSLITSQTSLQLGLDSQTIPIAADPEKSRRVQNAIDKYDKYAIDSILLVLRSCKENKEQIAFNYIKKLMREKRKINKMFSLPEVIAFNDTLEKVTGEAHKIKGFLRFMESADGVLYAPYAPDNDITELILPHFIARLKEEKFVIHDTKRKIAGMYDRKHCVLCNVGDAEIYLSKYEKTFENLWKKYYEAVNIASRPHEKQMKGYMPVRYWKFLPEKKN